MRLPKLPQLLDRKIYKTGQTRGADDDVIYQNRVSRTSTVLIPYSVWKRLPDPPPGDKKFEHAFIVHISPDEYFDNKDIEAELKGYGLAIGVNALVFYETREHWRKYNPAGLKWKPAQKRLGPLGGQYVARVPASTAADDGGKIIHGFKTTKSKGAGIRVYEYASAKTIKECRDQLEGLFWLCSDSDEAVVQNGMAAADAAARKSAVLKICDEQGLLNYTRLISVRILNKDRRTICPLCLEELRSKGFFSRLQQAEGRVVPDLTVTEINLFHIEELRYGAFNHRPYNLGWGHHHCNVVTKDDGIVKTLEWMQIVLERNRQAGLF
jgi:hypothetical protein